MSAKKSNQKPKKIKTATKKPKTLGSFKILSEREETFVKMDIEMSDDLSVFLLKKGKEFAKKNPEFYIQIGFQESIKAALAKHGINETSAGD